MTISMRLLTLCLAMLAAACTTVLGVTGVPEPDEGGVDEADASTTEGGVTPRTDGGGDGQSGGDATPGGPCTTPGARRCNGNVPQSCEGAGAWVSGAPCITCVSGACTEVCSPSAKRCNGNAVETCDATGQWQTSASCPYLCSGGACTGECAPSARQCSFSGSFPMPQVCSSSGTWTSTGSSCCNSCSGGYCQPGACASQCYRVPSSDYQCTNIYGSNAYAYYYQCPSSCASSGPSMGLFGVGHCTTGAVGAGRTGSLPTGAWCGACDQQC